MDADKIAKKAWERLANDMERAVPGSTRALPPGASATRLDALEVHVRHTLPSLMRQVYSIHDGLQRQAASRREPLLCLERIRQEWDACVAAHGVDSGRWRAAWLPVGSDGAGNYVCLNLAQSSGLPAGCLLQWWHESDDHRMFAKDLAEYMTKRLEID